MSDISKLILLSVFCLAFWALLFYAIGRNHGISLKRQIRSARIISRRFGADVMSVFGREMQGRQDRRVATRHESLCQGAAAADRALAIINHQFGEPPGVFRVSSEHLAEFSKRRADAIMELRNFLGRLTPEQTMSIARAADCECGGDLDGDALYAFLCQESERADDASDDEILRHYQRFQALVGKLVLAACQTSEKRL